MIGMTNIQTLSEVANQSSSVVVGEKNSVERCRYGRDFRHAALFAFVI